MRAMSRSSGISYAPHANPQDHLGHKALFSDTSLTSLGSDSTMGPARSSDCGALHGDRFGVGTSG
jgi:hypothetical protein